MTIESKQALWFYRLSRILITAWLKWKFPFSTSGLENIPDNGGLIIASNHASYLDPPVLAVPIKNREVRFMARDTLFKNPVASWVFYRLGVVPLSREKGDVAAIKTAIQLLKSGQCVGLYPEGTRTLDGNIHEPKGGIGFLIAKADVPVVPVYISGTFEAFPKGAGKMASYPIHVSYGKPILPEELHIRNEKGKADFDAIGRLVMDRITQLRDQTATS
jgi:1-acyl-sn-glycerol-3-phosphate acyltransferase